MDKEEENYVDTTTISDSILRVLLHDIVNDKKGSIRKKEAFAILLKQLNANPNDEAFKLRIKEIWVNFSTPDQRKRNKIPFKTMTYQEIPESFPFEMSEESKFEIELDKIPKPIENVKKQKQQKTKKKNDDSEDEDIESQILSIDLTPERPDESRGMTLLRRFAEATNVRKLLFNINSIQDLGAREAELVSRLTEANYRWKGDYPSVKEIITLSKHKNDKKRKIDYDYI